MSAPKIEWEDGYPTDESLAAAKVFFDTSGLRKESAEWLRRTLSECARMCCASYHEVEALSVSETPVWHLHFSTGGWSGAEDVIELVENCFFLAGLMIEWRRGGHYIFEVPRKEAAHGGD